MTTLGVHTSKKPWKIENRSETNDSKIWNICLVGMDRCLQPNLFTLSEERLKDMIDILIPTCGENL